METRFKQVLCTLLVAIMLVTAMPFAASAAEVWVVSSGKCGEELTWTYSSDGSLKISGKGKMYGYTETSVPWCDFRDSVKSIVIEQGVSSIGNNSFSVLYNLKSVTIPASVKKIAVSAFSGCTTLTEFAVNSSSKYFSSLNGVLFNRSKTKLIKYACGKKDKTYVIPDTVTSICDHAFRGCSKLKSVTIPGSVKSIGEAAFSACIALTSAKIPSGVTSIGEMAFSACSLLTSLTIPDSVKSLGGSAFSGCDSLKKISIGSGLKSIGRFALPTSLQLTGISVSSANKYFSSANGVMFNKSKTKLIKYPSAKSGSSYTIPKSVKVIDEHAFFMCNALQKVTIPDSVKTIGNSAFYGCRALNTVTIPAGVQTIGEGAFTATPYYDSGSWENRGYYVSDILFRTEFSIDKYAFELKSTARLIADEALRYDEKITGFSVSSANKYFSATNGVLFNKSKTKLIRYPSGSSASSYTVPGSVKSIADYAFRGSAQLTSVKLPKSLTSVGDHAFYAAYKLKSISLPNSVTSIGDNAFLNCIAMKKVTIGSGLKSIGESVFGTCMSITSLTVSSANKYFSSSDGVLFNKSKTRLIQYPCGNTRKTYSVPGSVKTIDERALFYCDNLKNLIVSSAVKSFGNYGETNGENHGVTIYGIPGSAAEAYADTNYLFTFRDATSLTRVSAVKVSKKTTSAVTIKWSAVAGASGYAVYKYNSSTKKYVRVKTVTTAYCTVSGLKADSDVKLRVRAFRNVGSKNYYGSYSSVCTAHTA